MDKNIFSIFFVLFVLMCVSCSNSGTAKGQALYESQCASCHLLPNVQDVPKNLWKDVVLPEMGARMGIPTTGYDPYKGFSFEEQYAMIQSGVYGVSPSISKEDWQLLVDYVLSNAPDSLRVGKKVDSPKNLEQFMPMAVNLDSIKGSLLTFAEYDTVKNKMITADTKGLVYEYDAIRNNVDRRFSFGSPITAFSETDYASYITSVGILDPSEKFAGSINIVQNGTGRRLPFKLHRPVHTLVHDLNEDGSDELIICEFGNLTGQLSLLQQKNDSIFERKVLLNRPGAIRTIVRDMNRDGKDDIIVMTAQGDEGISILYQSDNLVFNIEQVIRFSPISGSSWFEVLDYDGDGNQDIISVHGDNGDKTQVLKPYHGMRIHLNDGTNHFSEAFFYPFHGATRSVSRDFDQDGDIDIALISTFPDYSKRPEQSFIYLENKNSSDFNFQSYRLPENISGRWFLMDAGDVDSDGDEDIVLTCFTYSFTPLPEDLSTEWRESDVDMVILKNSLF
ncbi:hypothetical protein LCGC14_1010290 [marine sediment metagenome]|uniref:VCBS repeat-containing protein n=2 Tax=root TaxID=1 RepID=A0A831QR22_9FLAO|nr:VCBS repeat-containing protein [Pricia antarctica]